MISSSIQIDDSTKNILGLGVLAVVLLSLGAPPLFVIIGEGLDLISIRFGDFARTMGIVFEMTGVALGLGAVGYALYKRHWSK